MSENEITPAQLTAAKVMIFVGVFLVGLIAVVAYMLWPMLMDPEAASESGRFDAPPEAMRYIGYGLAGLFCFGLLTAINGFFFVRTHRKNIVLTLLTIVALLAGIVAILLATQALNAGA